MAETKARRGDIGSVVEMLESHDSGRTMGDLSRDVREAIQRARELASDEGSATVKFTISAAIVVSSKGRAEMKLTTQCTPPRAAHPTTTLYVAAEGTLATTDPKQPVFEFAKKTAKTTAEE